jgi:CBS domain-containing protein
LVKSYSNKRGDHPSFAGINRAASSSKRFFPDLIELDQRAMMRSNARSKKYDWRLAMRAMDVMTTPVVTVTPDTTVQDLAKLLSEKGISGVPVVEGGDRLVGIVSEGDLLHRADSKRKQPATTSNRMAAESPTS